MVPTYRPRFWHLVLVGLIALFDLGVLYMVVSPRVGQDYYDYYISRSASCFPRLISGYYPLGEPVSFVPGRNGYDLDTIRWCGFMPPSTTGIRSFGDYGILHLKFPDPGRDLLLTFTSWVNTDSSKPKRDVQVVVNGEQVGVVTYATAARVDGKIVIPARLVAAGHGTMEIRFDVPRIGPPGTNSEPVTLQLRLEALRLTPIGADTAAVQPTASVSTAPATATDRLSSEPPPTRVSSAPQSRRH